MQLPDGSGRSAGQAFWPYSLLTRLDAEETLPQLLVLKVSCRHAFPSAAESRGLSIGRISNDTHETHEHPDYQGRAGDDDGK